MTRAALVELNQLLLEIDYRNRGNAILAFRPYEFQKKFFALGATQNQRLLMAANRVGKTECGADEMSYHLTGKYPEWWKGRRFDHPVDAWAASDTDTTTRDIVQSALFGDPLKPDSFGTGTIPRNLIYKKTMKSGTPQAIEGAVIKHISGGYSTITLKSYAQGREKWQGTSKHVVWLDEEPPDDIYSEAFTRTLDCGGIIYLTFTPLKGLSSVVRRFLQPEHKDAPDNVVTATWDDAPHLDGAAKEELWASIPPHQRDARAKGIPVIGSGLIYPVEESAITVEDFNLPAHWPRFYALDVGWNKTAAVWGCWDRSSDTIFIYSVYYVGQLPPPVHAEAIKARGAWIDGVADPAALGSNQRDGTQLITEYRKLGLGLIPADNSVEAGLHAVWNRLVTGRLKIFASCREWFAEYRMYHRDENGKIIKERDHLMDCTRYLVMSGLKVAKVEPVEDEIPRARIVKSGLY